MAVKQFMVPANVAFNSRGLAVPGAVARLYETGTTTPALFYADSGLSTSLGSSITANGVGRFPDAYQDEDTPFRIVIEDADGVELEDMDPYYFGANNIVARSTGVTPQMFGAEADGTTDDSEALQEWLDHGGPLVLPVGEYYSSAKLILRKSATINGEGYGFDARESGYGDMPGSRIRFAAGVHGLEIQTQTTVTDVATAVAAGVGGFTQEGAFNSHISNIGLIGANTGAATHGIILRTKAHLENIHVIEFEGKGIDVVATSDIADGNDYGNANMSTIRNCKTASCGSHGLHIRGRDANTILVENLDSTANGGWGILDESLLGNSYLKPHLAGNTLGAIKANGAVSRNVFSNVYIETGTGSNVDIIGANTIIGGGDVASANAQTTDVPAQYGSSIATIQMGKFVNNSGAPGAITTKGYAFWHGVSGMCIQGAGSGSDVTIVNKSGSVVMNVVTGSLNATFAGALLPAGYIKITSATGAWPGLTSGQATAYAHASAGLVLGGYGSANDITMANSAAATVMTVPTGTVNAVFAGDVSVADEAYDATAWNGSLEVPTKNAVRDKIETLASTAPTESLVIACSDETTALSTGTAKVTFRMPYAFTVTAVRASLTTAQTSGSIFTVDINESGTTILSTKLTIDNTEKTSTTAATAAVISDSALADDAEITVDIDQVGDGTAKGLKVYLIGHR